MFDKSERGYGTIPESEKPGSGRLISLGNLLVILFILFALSIAAIILAFPSISDSISKWVNISHYSIPVQPVNLSYSTATPQSVQECEGIVHPKSFNTGQISYIHNTCIHSVAVIKGDPKICLNGPPVYQEVCLEDVKNSSGTTFWGLRKSGSLENASMGHPLYDDPVVNCAVFGFKNTTVGFYSNYTGERITYYDDAGFIENCQSLLKDANESICQDNATVASYDSKICTRNIRLAKGLPVSEVCSRNDPNCYFNFAIYQNDSDVCPYSLNLKDYCFRSIAIKTKASDLCSLTNSELDPYFCWQYFALSNKDLNFCEKLTGDVRHYCRAVLLAQNGS